MKEKILQALKTKYSNFGLSEKAFDGVAENLSQTVKEEANIEAAVAGVEWVLKTMQAESDRERGAKAQLEAQLEELKKKQSTKIDQPKEPAPKGEEVPAWAKAILEENKALKEAFASLQTSSISKTRAESLESILEGTSEIFSKATKSSFELLKDADDEKFASWLENIKETAQEDVTRQASYVPGSARSQKNPSDMPSSSDVESAYKYLKGE